MLAACSMVDVTARFEAFLLRPVKKVVRAESQWGHFLGEAASAATADEIEYVEGLLKNIGDPSLHSVGTLIVGMLYDRLKVELGEVQSHDLEKLKREVAVKKYFVPQVESVNMATNYIQPHGVEMEVQGELEAEAELLLIDYQTDADQVLNVRRHLQETSTLLTLLSTRAVEQEEVIGSVLHVANESIGHIESAEAQLKQATKNNSSYRAYVVGWFLILSFLLLFLDIVQQIR